MAGFELKKVKDFSKLDQEVKFLISVGTNLKTNSKIEIIENNLEDLKICLTNLQITAREFRKAYKFNDLKTDIYQRKLFDYYDKLNYRIRFWKDAKNLINEGYLNVIKEGTKKLAASNMKLFRQTKLIEYREKKVKFTALNQQIKRLIETLATQIETLKNYSEISKRYIPVSNSNNSKLTTWKDYFNFKIKSFEKSDFYFVTWKDENGNYSRKLEDLEITKLEEKLIKKYEKIQSKLKGRGRPKKSTYLINWTQTT